MALKSQEEKEVGNQRVSYRQDKQFLLQCVWIQMHYSGADSKSAFLCV